MPGKVKTFQQIADEYGIHRYTLRKRILPIRPQLQITKKRRKLLPWQSKLIYSFLNVPESAKRD